MLTFDVFPPTESIRRNVIKRPFVSSNLSSEVQEKIYKDMELMSEQKIRSIYSGKIELITYSIKLYNILVPCGNEIIQCELLNIWLHLQSGCNTIAIKFVSDSTHDKISRDKVAFAVRDNSVIALKEVYPGKNAI